jgi:hypothetical protein
MSMSVGCVSVVPTMTSLGSLISSATVSSSLEIVSEGPCEDKRNAGDVSDYVGEDGT